MDRQKISQTRISAGAIEAAVRMAHCLGTGRVDPVILQELQHISVRLFPMDVLGTRDLPQALDDCNEALRLLPHHGDTLSSRGLVRFKLGAFDQAFADYDAALKQDAGDAGSLYGRRLGEVEN
jgi:tetratricopeptide (TPR) repeat protein